MRQKRYRYGVIVVTRDRPDLLARCLEHLSHTVNDVNARPRIVVWDNGTDPETPAICKQYRATRLTRVGVNISFSVANNEAAKRITGDLLLLNNDVFLQPGAIEALIAERQNGCDVVGAKLLYPDGRIQHYGVGFSREMHPFHVGRFEPADCDWASERRVVPVVTAALTLINREWWDRLDGFGEEYRFGYEDVDFCLRARESGAVVGVTPGAVAVHLESQTAGRSSFDDDNWRTFKRGWLDTGRINAALGVWPFWLTPGVQRIVGPDADMAKVMLESS